MLQSVYLSQIKKFISQNMWLPFKWRRINHSSDPSCRLTSSTIRHLLLLSLTHLNKKQSCPFSFLQGALLFAPFDLNQTVACNLMTQALVHLLFPPYITWSVYQLKITLCRNTCYLRLNCAFVWEGLEPSFVLQIQLRAHSTC
jgi:hypothetical protein